MGSSSSSTHQSFTVRPSSTGLGPGPWQETDPEVERQIEETRQGLEADRLAAGDVAEDQALDDLQEDPSLAELVEQLRARNYRGERTEVSMPNATGLRAALRENPDDEAEIDVIADLGDGIVAGRARVARNSEGFGHVVDASELRCASHTDGSCEHAGQAGEAIAAVLDSRRVRTSLQEWEANTAGVADDLATDHARSVAARATPQLGPEGPSWAEETAPFQAAYDAARARSAAGEAVVPFYTDNATGGLGAREGGRGFGVELEFDLPNTPHSIRDTTIAAIGRDLHAAGLTTTPHRQGYHASQDYSNWRFEYDSTVAGEVISPILYDEPASWNQLQQVCDIIRRHGGRANARTGGHIHVGVGDFDHTVENHRNLLGVFNEHEDVLYRMSMNPAANRQRGQSWCSPNRVPASGFTNIGQVANSGGHTSAVNFGAVRGNSTDHVEFRMWDGSLDPGVIQAQVNMSLGMTHAALHAPRGAIWGHEPIGLNRQRTNDVARGGRLVGDRWRENTASFRRLMDRVFSRATNREQATALFAATHWQQPR